MIDPSLEQYQMNLKDKIVNAHNEMLSKHHAGVGEGFHLFPYYIDKNSMQQQLIKPNYITENIWSKLLKEYIFMSSKSTHI